MPAKAKHCGAVHGIESISHVHLQQDPVTFGILVRKLLHGETDVFRRRADPHSALTWGEVLHSVPNGIQA